MALAFLLPQARAVFYDANGDPLEGGYVNTYVPGGTVPKLTWEDSDSTTPNANPVLLDANGSCLLYGVGAYQITVTDALGNQIPAYSGLTEAAPISAAMAPVVSADTVTAALELLGVSAAMIPVVQAISTALALQVISSVGTGIFGPSSAMGLGVAVTGTNNGIVGQIVNDLPPASVAYPAGIVGYGSVTTAGNGAWGVFARADLSTMGVPGTAVNEVNTFNFAGGPTGTQPANLGFGTTDYNCNALQAVAYGNYQSSIGYAVLFGEQTFQYGIYISPNAVGNYGMLIDANSTAARTGAAAVIRETATSGVPTLILQSKGTFTGTGNVFQVADDAGTAHFTINQQGDFGTAGIAVGHEGTINYITTTIAAGASPGSNGALPAQVAGYLVQKVNGTSVKIPYYAP